MKKNNNNMKKKNRIIPIVAIALLVAAGMSGLAACSGKGAGASSQQGGDTGSAASGHGALPHSTLSAPAGTHQLDIPQPPLMMTGDAERMDYLATHYWDNFDLRDTTWIADTTALESAFYAWAEVLQRLPQGRAPELARGFIGRAVEHKAPVAMLLRLASVAEHYFYHPNSPFRNEELYIPVLQAVISAPKLDDVYKIRPRKQLETAQKNRPGAVAANFIYTTASGETHSLHQPPTRGGAKGRGYTLLFFYNPDCEDCRRVRQLLATSTKLAPLIEAGSLHVLAIYADEDIDLWRRHLPQMPAGWTVGYDKEQVILRSALYDLKAIPCLYLLDKDMRVVLKDAQVGEVVRLLACN